MVKDMAKNNRFEERKKTIYNLMGDELYVPMKKKEIAGLLGVTKDQRSALDEVLDSLVEEGKVVVTPNGRYMKSVDATFKGTFVANAQGFGFIEVEGEKEDYFVSASNTMNAMQGDTVEAVVINKNSGKRKEAKVLKIVTHGVDEIVGTYEDCKTFGFVVCDNVKFDRDIFIPSGKNLGAVTGHKVVVKINDYGSDKKNPEGEVIEILGHANDPGVDILSIVKAFDIPCEFSEKVLKAAVSCGDTVSPEAIEGRKDLRDWTMVTIDGDDTKDIDDAVSLFTEGENYILGVHIADVSNYVVESSALDVEAYKRGTSVYLADRVIPMLPHALSNGICSLNEGVDRLAMSCIMTINAQGKIIDHEICESVIKSNKQMTYTVVNAIINGDEELAASHGELSEMFIMMDKVAKLLRERRNKRGAIDFDLPESKLEIDENGACVGIHEYDRNDATRLIEDFMLAANETVAEHFFWLNVPFLYRVHGNPDAEKVKTLKRLMGSFGYVLHGDPNEMKPKEFQKVMEQMQGKEEEKFLSQLMLRSMQQAKYEPECKGHFGLAATYYCHFTSPIRRYPDLQIHRIMKDYLHGDLKGRKAAHYGRILEEVGMSTSKSERRAEECEREVTKLKKAQYMSAFVGEEFEAFVSSVTGWGLYVTLPNTVEGLIHVSSMRDDHYVFSEESYELIGTHRHRIYRVGMPVKVRLIGVDMAAKNIDFELI